MKKRCFTISILLWATLIFAGNAGENLRKPVGFIENKGQFRDQYGNPNPDVLYMADFGGMKVLLRKDGFSYEVYQVKPKWVDPATIPYKILTFLENGDTLVSWPGKAEAEKELMYHYQRVDVALVGANLNPEILAEGSTGETKRYVNAAKGGESMEVAGFSQVRYNGVYPGIDLVVYSQNEKGGFKYDFILSPGANLSEIELKYKGAESLELEESGNLNLKTRFGKVSESIPACYTEDISGNRKEVFGIGYLLEGNKLCFTGKAIQFDEKLVIDPSVNIYRAGYYGGDSADRCTASVTDSIGNTYLCGNTMSFPIATSGAFQDSLLFPWDGFLMKVNHEGQQQWATYLGGFNANDIGVDYLNNLVVASDSGMMTFDNTGQLQWIFYKPEKRNAVTCDNSGNIITVGDSVVKMNPQGIEIWKNKFGGTGTTIRDVDCDAFGNIYFAGHTTDSAGIGTPNSHLPTYSGTNLIGTGMEHENMRYVPKAGDGFFAKMNVDGVVEYSSYYGGHFFDEISNISVTDSGYFVIAGSTNSRDGISTPGSFQDTLRHQGIYCFLYLAINGGWDCPDGYWKYLDTCILNCFHPNPAYDNYCQSTDAFIAKFSPEGTRQWGSYYGDTDSEFFTCAEINKSGDTISIGGNNSGNRPVIYDYNAIPRVYVYYKPNLSSTYSYNSIGGPAYLAQFNSSGERLWGTYFPNPEDALNNSDYWRIEEVSCRNKKAYVSGTSNDHYGYSYGYYSSGSNAFVHSFVVSEFTIDTIIEPRNTCTCIGNSTNLCTGIITTPQTDKIFQWYKNGAILIGETDSILTIPATAIEDTGTYFCQIRHLDFYWNTKTVSLGIRETPAVTSATTNNTEIIFPDSRLSGDLDSDGDFDVVCSQYILENQSISFLRTDSIPCLLCESSFYDLYNTNQPDLYTVDNHHNTPNPQARLLKNVSGSFINIEDPQLFPVSTWADFDNDGSLEGFKTVSNQGYFWGPFNFSLLNFENEYFVSTYAGYDSIMYISNPLIRLDNRTNTADFDHDGDVDILMNGYSLYSYHPYNTQYLFLLTNNGGVFTVTPMIGQDSTFNDTRAQWFDMDADGDLDILSNYWFYTGTTTEFYDMQICVLENENGVFHQIFSDTVEVNRLLMFQKKPVIFDYDNDGLPDFSYRAHIWIRDTTGYHQVSTSFNSAHTGLTDVTNATSDFDHDGDLDILGESHIYINDVCNPPNSPPSAPCNPISVVSQDTVRFSWINATDAQTPTPGLTYNLRVGTTPGGNNIMSSLSDSTGWRKVVGMGNVYQNNSWWLHDLDEGTYYWSVQAIDNSFAGGPFSSQDTLSVYLPIEISNQPSSKTVCLGDTLRLEVACNHFFPLSYQWYKGSIPIQGATDSLLLIAPVSELHVGNYHCNISNQQFSVNSDSVGVDIIDVPHHRLSLFQESQRRCEGDSIVLKARKQYPFFCHQLSFQWYFENEPMVGKNDSLLIINSFDSTSCGDYFCQIIHELFSTNTDTINLIFLTTHFVSDTVFTTGGYIFTELNKDGDWDIFQSLSLYSLTSNSNITDLDRDGIPDQIARQDSVRFYKSDNNAWIPMGIAIPGASQIRARDLDNNGTFDFLIHRGSYETQLTAIIFMNDSTNDQVTIDQSIMEGTMDLVDIDNDKDFDVFETGWNYPYFPKTRVWINNDGIFTESASNIPGYRSANTDWGDFDNDGDMDLIISGRPSLFSLEHITRIYRNENSLFFETPFLFNYYGQVKWFDYDNNGLLDIMLGQTIFQQKDGDFVSTGIMGHEGLLFDYDNDGDVDIHGNWYESYWSNGNEIFLNESCSPPNIPPFAPALLSTNISSDSVFFSWFPASDAQTPSPGLSYNMRVGTTPGGCQIMSPMSNPSGFRQVVELGNCQQNLGWWLHSLPPGTYYWSVQAIDNSFAGGPFAPEQSFTIAPPVPVNTSVSGDTINDGEMLCFDATNTITVGGIDSAFRVNPGANVTLIAGQKIRLLSGTSVDVYGYLHGYIAADNQYCFAATQPIVASKETAITNEPGGLPDNDSGRWSLKVFPNPVSEVLNIRIETDQPGEPLILTIHDLPGKKIIEKTVSFTPQMQLPVVSLKPGVYIFRAVQGEHQGAVKLIK